MRTLRKLAIDGSVALLLLSSPALSQGRYLGEFALFESYKLWGYLEGVASACTDATSDPSPMHAFDAWRTKNQGIRETLDVALIASGKDPALVAEAEDVGRQHGLKWVADPSDKQGACELWLWQMEEDAFNPETFISFPLETVREYLQSLPRA